MLTTNPAERSELRPSPTAPLAPGVSLQLNESRMQANLATMRTYFDLLFSKNMDGLLDLVDPNIEWLIVPTGDVIKGKGAFETLAKNHWAASPNRTKTLVNLFANEEFASMEYVTGGTLTGEADFGSLRLHPTGAKYELQCCFVFHFSNGKIDRVREYFDMETVKRVTGQPGRVPA
jgi:ketosteroid isomerase-like protein